MDELVALAKRRGFIFQSSDIYGGLQGVYDYGPLGVELKNNLKAAWWRAMVYERDDVEGLDAAILTNPTTLKHSGHEDTFTDPLVDCRSCKSRWRADHITDGICPGCGANDLTEPRPFNLMFKTQVGPVQDENGNFAYLRPETAQAIFTNFKNVVDSTSPKLPFGIAQIGKAFRNEITPRNFIFRVREFEQMELEFFVRPGEDDDWHEQWVEARLQWWAQQGVPRDTIELYHVPSAELAHYSKATVDLMYRFPHGVEEPNMLRRVGTLLHVNVNNPPQGSDLPSFLIDLDSGPRRPGVGGVAFEARAIVEDWPITRVEPGPSWAKKLVSPRCCID